MHQGEGRWKPGLGHHGSHREHLEGRGVDTAHTARDQGGS